MSAARKVLKWTVSVDDRPHPIGVGKPVLTACQEGPHSVQVWTEEELGAVGLPTGHRMAQVFGTGHKIPEGWEHVGSYAVAAVALVWHVYAEPVAS